MWAMGPKGQFWIKVFINKCIGTQIDRNENTYLNKYTEHHKSIENSSDNITEFHNVNFLVKK